jgi:hypothetical protein
VYPSRGIWGTRRSDLRDLPPLVSPLLFSFARHNVGKLASNENAAGEEWYG